MEYEATRKGLIKRESGFSHRQMVIGQRGNCFKLEEELH